uniref:WGS project CBMI000000000 data, contig CS3069_c004994 n=1 Tax=Fusarium clavum TaxID=2594811 RepID=A0A090MF31_9HYPO|nr:unnamed protein product [Fusarium clavum]
MPSTIKISETAKPRFDVISARYRAAWPELRFHPLEVGKAPLPPFILPHVKRLEEQAREILARYQIKFDDEEEDEVEVQLVNQGLYARCIPTLLITAPWSVDRQEEWKNAVHDIAELIYNIAQEANFDHTKVHVDMKDPKLTKTIYFGDVEESFCDTAEWDTIKKVVRKRLQSFEATKGQMSTMMLLRYGVLEQIEANPVTIYISLFDRSDETGWLEVINDIQNNLDKHGWKGVYIHMEHNEPWTSGWFD